MVLSTSLITVFIYFHFYRKLHHQPAFSARLSQEHRRLSLKMGKLRIDKKEIGM